MTDHHQIHHTPLEFHDRKLEIYRMPVADGLLTQHADRTAPHAHSYYEIVWFEEGGGTHMVDFIDYPILPNTFILIAPGQVHAFCHGPRPKGIVIDFDPSVFPPERRHDNLYVRHILFGEQKPRYVINDPELIAYMHHMVNALETEMTLTDALGHNDMLGVMLKVVLLLIYRKADEQGAMSYSSNIHQLRLFARFRAELEMHYTDTRTVQEYADMLGVSVKQLSAAAQECAGCAPHSLIEDRVTLEARRMLQCTDLMVKEIADELGFDDVSYFIKFFKNNAGVLPTDFRYLRGENPESLLNV